jgi:uncharacterized protein (DUF1499 family)
MTKKSRRYGGVALLLAALSFCAVERRWFTTNDVTTGHTPEYPELQPRIYAADLNATRQAAEAACASLRRWRIVSTPDAPELHAEVRTALFGFVDDVTVRFEPLPSFAAPAPTRVLIRSRSRVGKGDLGENARHIRALQAAMDARLKTMNPQMTQIFTD